MTDRFQQRPDGIDIQRLQVSARGTDRVDALMQQFMDFAQFYAAQNGIAPKEVTMVNFLTWLADQQNLINHS